MAEFKGIIPPLCTPLADDGTVDRRSLERLVERQLGHGVHGLFALGSSGEAIYLTDAARREVLETVVGAVAGAVPVFAGAVDGATARVIEQVRWISAFKVDAIVVTAPFYANVSDSEIVAHFGAIAAASPFPLIAYDIPGNVGRKLPADVTIELLRKHYIVGIKDTSGEIDEFFRVVREMGPREGRSMICGTDKGAGEWLARGADGVVPGIGNVCGDLFVGLYDAFLRGDTAEVERRAEHVAVINSILGVGMKYGLGLHASQLGSLKHTLVRYGTFATERVSPPLTQYPAEAGREVDAIMASIGR
jgi:4-hydroxy-tetrahydrodipicolinate synthase